MGSRMVRGSGVAAGGVVQFLDKVADVPVAVPQLQFLCKVVDDPVVQVVVGAARRGADRGAPMPQIMKVFVVVTRLVAEQIVVCQCHRS